jgi:erythromycin esterase-like protein
MLLAAFAIAAAPPPAEASAWEAALRAAEHDLCSKQVALLGENGFHGDGKTPAFKAALIRRLVTRCGYRAVFFEASHYDFLAVQRAVRRGEPVTEAMVSSSIGGLWNQDKELVPLVSFLAAEARAKRVTLGGLDDQIGSWRAFYSLDTMRSELAAFLPAERREPCKVALWQRMSWDYSDASPHDWTSVRRVQACVAGMREGVLASGADAPARDEYLEMLANIDRLLLRELANPKASIAGRDQSMYFNFRWMAARLKPGTKIIVWAANQHVAKDPALAADFVADGSLGAAIHAEYGARAFALGFSAAGGAFRWGRGAKPISPAAPESIEAKLMAGSRGEAAYAGPAAVAALGTRPSTLFNHEEGVSRRWRDVFDGVVVFRTERPPVRVDE